MFDWTVADNTLLITDGVRSGLYAFNGTTLTEWSSTLMYVSGTVTFFSDRVWIANIVEDGVYHNQRIRWSSLMDHTSFDAADYYDIPTLRTPIKRVVPLGRLLAVYFEDGIYLGTPSNLLNLPYEFKAKIETRGIGLFGKRAVTSVLNGHFFVGQDDVYYLSVDGELTPLYCPVRESTISGCSSPENIYVVHDIKNDQIVFGFPGAGETIENAWFYNYKTKAWSYDNIAAFFIANPGLSLDLTWLDLPAVLSADTWAGMDDFVSWDAISDPADTNLGFIGQDNFIYYLSEDSLLDVNLLPIDCRVMTGDLDFGDPDSDKTVTRMTVRLAERLIETQQFSLLGSENAGSTWKQLGTLTIGANELEGKVDFRITGSALRFYLVPVYMSQYDLFTITEMTFRVAKRGLETKLE